MTARNSITDRLDGSVAAVTGGGSGIGRETALTLADRGASIAIFDINRPAGDSVAQEVIANGGHAIAVTGDASSEEDVVRFFATVAKALGDVDIAVPCAAVVNPDGPFDTMPIAEFDRVMAVNVRGTYLVVQQALRHMRRHHRGAIVCLSSLDGLQAEHSMSPYCISKAAILNLVRAAALDVAPEQIRVNAVCPSVTDTSLLRNRLATLPDGDAILAAYERKHPMGRILKPSEIAYTIAFLVSPLASGITGTAISVDAGLGATWDVYVEPAWLRQPLSDAAKAP